ncbi:MAG: FkbM family methyltransferase [Brevinematales bacterium]|nr:FkbM family methyltransferase [Brevinematales bacterium]
MGLLKSAAKWVHRVLPDGNLKWKLSAMGYRAFYKKALKDFRYKDGIFTAVFNNGIEIKSVADFDPDAIISNLLNETLDPGSVAMDWGGHYGLVSVYMAKKVGPAGKVIAFEADPKNYGILKRNLELNGVDNVRAVDKGIFDATGWLEFYSGGGYTSSFQKTDYVEKDKNRFAVARIPVTTLDDMAEELHLNRINLIKIDIEGSELPALKGAEKTLRRCKPALLIETHVVDGKGTADDVIGFLRTVGYEKIIVEDTYYGLPFIRAL